MRAARAGSAGLLAVRSAASVVLLKPGASLAERGGQENGPACLLVSLYARVIAPSEPFFVTLSVLRSVDDFIRAHRRARLACSLQLCLQQQRITRRAAALRRIRYSLVTALERRNRSREVFPDAAHPTVHSHSLLHSSRARSRALSRVRVGSYSQSSLESLWKLRRRCEPAEPLLVVGLRRRGIVIRGAAAVVCFASLCESARCAARVLLLVKSSGCPAEQSARQRFRESVAR